jgi:hypothetical protein
MRRFYYLAYLGSARRLYYYPITVSEFEPGGIEVINLDAASKNDAYNLGH